MLIHHIVICGLSGCNIFTHVNLQKARFCGKKFIGREKFIQIFSINFTEIFLILTKIQNDSFVNVI